MPAPSCSGVNAAVMLAPGAAKGAWGRQAQSASKAAVRMLARDTTCSWSLI